VELFEQIRREYEHGYNTVYLELLGEAGKKLEPLGSPRWRQTGRFPHAAVKSTIDRVLDDAWHSGP
jgi:hypothetical protein